jgi:hypothetical protein
MTRRRGDRGTHLPTVRAQASLAAVSSLVSHRRPSRGLPSPWSVTRTAPSLSYTLRHRQNSAGHAAPTKALPPHSRTPNRYRCSQQPWQRHRRHGPHRFGIPRDHPSRASRPTAKEWPLEAVPHPGGFRRDPDPPRRNGGRSGRAGCRRCADVASRAFQVGTRAVVSTSTSSAAGLENSTPPLSPPLMVHRLGRTKRTVRCRSEDGFATVRLPPRRFVDQRATGVRRRPTSSRRRQGPSARM